MFGQVDKMCSFYMKALDAASLRQKVLSENLANINTPGYQQKDVAFKELMTDMVDREGYVNANSGKKFTAYTTDSRHKKFGQFQAASFEIPVTKKGGNMDINQLMVDQVQNEMIYQQMSEKVGGLLSGLNYVIDNAK